MTASHGAKLARVLGCLGDVDEVADLRADEDGEAPPALRTRTR
jgi:hypothetical protein